ncbi:hypothetical protein [Paraburkholderia largidicola]|uniref:Uncharacterized protein n=1 Tax=Paraburkholderia largidicola TaxID=3014751 RepID=A0A7I8C285_9BURK|nr:hypothetical protein [Paraburkholderia sp. PGU16]BCF95152.1 hypothetical protein PPGU16_82190 [Paraburkholderia sp. PGU16]
MNDKFDMKLVIDAVTTPLLYEKLSQAGSARVRAALLRSLAEAALRGAAVVATAQQADAGTIYPAARDNRLAASPTSRSQPETPTRIDEPEAPRINNIALVNESDERSAHDVDQLVDAFGSYF